jgi:hypothetical protein
MGGKKKYTGRGRRPNGREKKTERRRKEPQVKEYAALMSGLGRLSPGKCKNSL